MILCVLNSYNIIFQISAILAQFKLQHNVVSVHVVMDFINVALNFMNVFRSYDTEA